MLPGFAVCNHVSQVPHPFSVSHVSLSFLVQDDIEIEREVQRLH